MRKNTGKKIVSYFLTMAMVVGGLSLSPIGTVGEQAMRYHGKELLFITEIKHTMCWIKTVVH